MIKNKKKFLYIFPLVVLAIGMVFTAYYGVPRAQSSAPGGYQTAWATSSMLIVTATKDFTAFATSTPNCTNRTITTIANPIMIKIGDHARFELGSNAGHYQAASTTVEYDSGLYGCGLWTIRGALSSNVASTQVFVSEFNDFR